MPLAAASVVLATTKPELALNVLVETAAVVPVAAAAALAVAAPYSPLSPPDASVNLEPTTAC